MNYDQDPYWQEPDGTPRWALAVAGLILLAGVVIAAAIFLSRGSDETKAVATHTPPAAEREVEVVPARQPETQTLPPATRTPRNADHDGGGGGGEILGPGAAASFESTAASIPAQLGLALAPVGGAVQEFGELREGHAWSSIKVPILATVMLEQGESLDSEEEAWAASAVTASDNEAAASLFGRIEETNGGLEGASRAVEGTLRAAGDGGTVVSTAPPPAGAVSTYGQTEWSLSGAVQFYGSLAGGCLLGPSGTEYVTGLMESVIPEQRWGLGEGGFPPQWSVGMKGGWGPDSGAGGAYLVRQSGFIREGDHAVAVAMIAIDDSGTYPAGASDLTQIAQWLAGELQGLGPASPC